MHHSDVEEQLCPVQPVQGSSLQAILYIDRNLESAKPPARSFLKQRHTAIGLSVVAAVCTFGAAGYALKQTSPTSALHSMLTAHVQPITQHVALQPVKPQIIAPVQHQIAAKHVVAARIVKPVQHQIIVAHPVSPIARRAVAAAKSPSVALHVPKPVQHQVIAMHPVTITARRPLTIIKHPSVALHRTKSVQHQVIAVHPVTVVATTMTHHHHHHAAHRRQVALLALPQLAIHDTPIQPVPAAASAVADPTITTFTASPQTIPEGSGATICVETRHATQLSISGIGELNPLLLDCRHVSPDVTTTYTAWAVNSLGVTVSQNVTITVTH